MLHLKIQSVELWDERQQMFVDSPEGELVLEHSLVAVSKWESKWKKPFLSDDTLTPEETLDYIQCMTTNEVPQALYLGITSSEVQAVTKYIKDDMTATVIYEHQVKTSKQKHSKEVITAELIYYQMTALNIPFECQYWHLNRLLMLIRVCGIKQDPGNKMSKEDQYKSNTQLNAERKALLNSKG